MNFLLHRHKHSWCLYSKILKYEKFLNVMSVCLSVSYLALAAGMLCFSTRFGCLEAQTEEKDIIPIIQEFFDDVGKSFDSIPWYKLKKTKFYRKFENEYDEIRR
ncbi:hypothetical protein KUTeg_011466 [Tegillarca granosa]|uniref:Uncharacterized protein n=1 Tax=Tegillarca granosa TaxID=220873 RepID=A0ABQ9F3Z7_TEGGR|nr:hypothetical protein KUTeg_011466 [Tegillarca granosa]